MAALVLALVYEDKIEEQGAALLTAMMAELGDGRARRPNRLRRFS